MEKAKLQVALDVLTASKALAIAQEVADYVDIIELGTPLLKKESTEIIKAMRASFPKKTILADLKTMDVGELEARLAFDAGADITTVCAAASDATIKAALKIARKMKKELSVDLIGIKDKVARAAEILKLEPHYLCVHTGIDEKGALPFSDLKKISELMTAKKSRTKLMVAGGISPRNIKEVLSFKPAVVVVGRAITAAKNPREAARALLSILRGRKIKPIKLKPTKPTLPLKEMEKELSEVLEKISIKETEYFLHNLLRAKRVFVTGQGRSGLVARAFAMRLMQLGFDVHVVGEATAPAMEKSDLLVAISGTGATKLTLDVINGAREKGTAIALLTANKNSPAAKKADLVIELPAKIDSRTEPLASLFEQAALLYLDSLIIVLMKRLGIASKEMWRRHA